MKIDISSPTKVLELFVAQNDVREHLCKPWHLGSCSYATNGHVMIKIDGQQIGIEQKAAHVKVVEFFESFVPRVGFCALPEVSNTKPCGCCIGHGSVCYDACYSCNGDGSFEHEGDDYDCKKCDGGGRLFGFLSGNQNLKFCPKCFGSGVESGEMMVGGKLFNVRYLKLLSALPGIEIASDEEEVGAACFRWANGSGLIMPLKQ